MKGRVETRQRHCHCQIELFMLMLMLWHHWHGFPAWPGSGAVSVSFITISGAQRLAHTKTTQTTVGQSTAADQSTNESLSHRQRINTKTHVFIRSLDISTHSWIHYGMQQFLLNYTMILDTYSRPPITFRLILSVIQSIIFIGNHHHFCFVWQLVVASAVRE